MLGKKLLRIKVNFNQFPCEAPSTVLDTFTRLIEFTPNSRHRSFQDMWGNRSNLLSITSYNTVSYQTKRTSQNPLR